MNSRTLITAFVSAPLIIGFVLLAVHLGVCGLKYVYSLPRTGQYIAGFCLAWLFIAFMIYHYLETKDQAIGI